MKQAKVIICRLISPMPCSICCRPISGRANIVLTSAKLAANDLIRDARLFDRPARLILAGF